MVLRISRGVSKLILTRGYLKKKKKIRCGLVGLLLEKNMLEQVDFKSLMSNSAFKKQDK